MSDSSSNSPFMAREAPSSSTCTARAAIKEADPSRAIIAIVDRKNARKLKALLKSESGWFTFKGKIFVTTPSKREHHINDGQKDDKEITELNIHVSRKFAELKPFNLSGSCIGELHVLRCSASTPDESRGYSKERTKSRRSDEGSRRAPPLTSRGSSNSKRRSRNRGRSRSTTNSGTISAGYATVAVSIIAAAGSAMLVAAAIYFVPWSKVFVWVRSTLGSSLLALINAAWVRLVSFVGQLVGVTDEG